jgi:16S rRNA (guanine966-N2)-methyltransferase
MFSTVTSLLGGLGGCVVLDLYAGSGALGLEALSRGAASCLFVEQDPRAAQVLRANLTNTGLSGGRVRVGDVASVLATAAPAPADLALLDPPYDEPASTVRAALARLVTGGWLGEGAVVVLERSVREAEPTWPAGLEVVRERRYGQTRLWYLRQSADDPS